MSDLHSENARRIFGKHYTDPVLAVTTLLKTKKDKKAYRRFAEKYGRGTALAAYHIKANNKQRSYVKTMMFAFIYG